jgi:hypothetical protein
MKLKLLLLLAVLIPCHQLLRAQQADHPVVRSLQAVRTATAPDIDGAVDDAVWSSAPLAGDFTQRSPATGQPSKLRTEVRVLYDDASLYVAARMWDVSGDSVLRQLHRRDEFGRADYFGLMLDTYNDDLNAFVFLVSSAGVQIDQRLSPAMMNGTGGTGFEWDAVWWSAVKILEDGWSAEMRIPYSAIRFPKTEVQQWGIQFSRDIARLNESSHWSAVNPAVNGFVNQFGHLTGLEGLKSPLRLSVMPYLSGYVENYSDPGNGVSENTYSINGGADLKYGINESFTLDMTLIPDFGQVQSDNQVLNLSPFEVQFNENRQFFTEGSEIFNKGGLFYSRRIGARPSGYWSVYGQAQADEEVVKNPSTARLLNATKLSGRTRKGLGIGVFNAITGSTTATLRGLGGTEREIETEPLTNFNEFVLDKSLKNNSYLTLINTNVMRSGGMYDANVTGTAFQFNNKKNTYGITGTGALSQLYFDGLQNVQLGHSYTVNAGKRSGNFMWNVSYDEKSHTFDPNDMGFLNINNQRNFQGSAFYNIYKPFWIFNRINTDANVVYTRMYNPNKFANFGTWASAGATFKNFWYGGLWTSLEPIITYDYFEPRVFGRYYTFPKNYNVGGWMGTNSSKRLYVDLGWNYRWFEDANRDRFNVNAGLYLTASDRLSFAYSLGRYKWDDEIGWVHMNGDEIILGRRNQLTYENVFTTSYMFTHLMGLSCRVRHYWATAKYTNFCALDEEGMLQSTTYTGLDAEGNPVHDVSFNAFNVDMVFTWRFAPGSEMRVVWKNSILSATNQPDIAYFENFGNTLASPQTNSISLKVLYYLDYAMVRGLGRKG